MNVLIEDSWKVVLKDEFEKLYFENLVKFIKDEKQKYTIFPLGNQIFAAFEQTPIHKVKVVILGQDPYHGASQAHGLCFSVNKGIAKPPSLQNIYKELNRDFNFRIPQHGNLSSWANQGVFLLNVTLTVRENQVGSHQGKGWEIFTDKVIECISNSNEYVVFMLWGNYARSKKSLINLNKHLVLEAPHPSPLSAHRGFIGCGHFSKANYFLETKGIERILWQID
jgi:uracil-DNA glycosylase